ncbi:hypothetical protein EIB18_15345 [Caulobacter vibrioides]|uniref:hypothetical protein n=1 Tax=Caulobacter vibrioides TaxID=155892 RepID=UPI000BB4DD87|nr:hypothetical protein [Caulobacter vibrioides]ATC25794.1 hypothetical protein CA608_15285 [Caulobacter vibrioides]AZH13938.1 hypothetical protein EIB18_15345 [Caulobacter vibrioides]PLR07580.1 hypothetical protein CVUC_18610 [Caulobacter vibrioides]
MTEAKATLILLAVAVLLIPLGVWAIRAAKRSRRALAPLAGMVALLGFFLTADPPPPPPAETATPRPDAEDEDDSGEPKD